jgi:hypothetical protein
MQVLRQEWLNLQGTGVAVALIAFFIANLAMIVAIAVLGLYEGRQRQKRLASLEILTKQQLGAELFEASKIRTRVEYSLMLGSALLYAIVTSALATLIAIFGREGGSLLQASLLGFAPAYLVGFLKLYNATDLGRLQSTLLLRTTIELSLVSIIAATVWLMMNPYVSTTITNVTVLYVVLGVIAALNYKEGGNLIRRWVTRRPEFYLADVEGVTFNDARELNRIGIRNVANLSNADPLRVFQQTSFELPQIIDWIGQAQLLNRFAGYDLNALHTRGVRTTIDLSVALKSTTPPKLVLSEKRGPDERPESSASSKAATQPIEVTDNYIIALLDKDVAFRKIADLSAAIVNRTVDLVEEFSRAPDQLNAIMKEALRTVVLGDPLTAYDGWMGVELLTAPAGLNETSRPIVKVSLSHAEPMNINHRARVLIEDGEPRDKVRFQLRLDLRSREEVEPPRYKWIEVTVHDGTETVEFELIPGPPPEIMWAMLYQAGRLIQVVEIGTAPSERPADVDRD